MANGDNGKTKTLDGKSISKNSCICKVCGKIDLIQAKLDGLLFLFNKIMGTDLVDERIQLNIIYNDLARISVDVSSNSLSFSDEEVLKLDKWIKTFKIKVDSFQRFKTPVSIELNETRTIIRMLEIELVSVLKDNKISKGTYMYINRLSLYFYYLALKMN